MEKKADTCCENKIILKYAPCGIPKGGKNAPFDLDLNAPVLIKSNNLTSEEYKTENFLYISHMCDKL